MSKKKTSEVLIHAPVKQITFCYNCHKALCSDIPLLYLSYVRYSQNNKGPVHGEYYCVDCVKKMLDTCMDSYNNVTCKYKVVDIDFKRFIFNGYDKIVEYKTLLAKQYRDIATLEEL